MIRSTPITLLILLVTSVRLTAEETDRGQASSDETAQVEFFEAKIRPVLVKQCYECHSEIVAEGNLRVDQRELLRGGGDRGPAVVPGKPNSSLILVAISHADADLRMPPKGPKLDQSTIADFSRWIEAGAIDPREASSSTTMTRWQPLTAAQNHWAYQAVTASQPPQVTDTQWSRGALDRFILAKLNEHDIQPRPDASPRTLLRRLHFDLLGLAPTPQVVERFLAASEQFGWDTAWGQEVERLLLLPQFGEHWGRHWLDVARFGESSGGESNVTFPYAWRYRDYVIDAINDDLPYDRFLTEQIAGDLLPFADDAERARLLIATGFLAVGTKNLGENNDQKFKADLVDEQIDSLTRGVLASSVACARCHDHKFDPFSMEDYYALAGVFTSSRTYFGTFVSPANNRGGDPLVLPRVAGQVLYHPSLSAKQFANLKAQHAELKAVSDEIAAAQRARLVGQQPQKNFTLRDVLANIWRLGPVEGKLETLDDQGRALPLAMGVLDDIVVDVPLLLRGEIGKEREIIPRRFPSALSVSGTHAVSSQHSGRLELAGWLTDPSHPLTSRVFVNRVWQHLFGHGLVASVDNFGTTGEAPSHPELLDTLAVEFMQDAWSLKQLVRKIVTSRTYQQASTYDSGDFHRDPENQWLWRMSKRKLTAEALRDSMLQVSGELDSARPGGSLVAQRIGDRPVSLIGLDRSLPSDLDGSLHRSVYLPVIRDRLPDVLELFDFAEPSLVTGQRESTNVPVQALFLMNSEFSQQRSRAFAQRLIRETASDQQLIELAFQLCFSRPPDAIESTRVLEFFQLGRASDSELDCQAQHQLSVLSFCQALFASAEYRIVD